MEVQDVTIASLSNMQQSAAAMERTVAVLKKQQDVAKDQGAALVSLIQSIPAPSGDVGTRLNVYA